MQSNEQRACASCSAYLAGARGVCLLFWVLRTMPMTADQCCIVMLPRRCSIFMITSCFTQYVRCRSRVRWQSQLRALQASVQHGCTIEWCSDKSIVVFPLLYPLPLKDDERLSRPCLEDMYACTHWKA